MPYVAFFVLTSAPFVASSPMFHPIHLPLPFVSPRSFRFVLPFLSALTSDSFTSSFSQVVHFVTSFLLFSVLPSVRLPLPFLSAHPFHCVRPFVATLPFHSLLPSLRLTLLNPVRYRFPFRFNSSLLFPIRRFFCFNLFSSVCYFPRIPSTRPTCSFTSSFHFKALISYDFVTSCLSLQRFHPVCLPLPFVSSRSFRYLLPFASTLLSCSSCSSFPFSVHFIASVLSLQHFPSIRYFLPFVSKLPSRSFASSCRFIIASVSTRTSRVLQA